MDKLHDNLRHFANVHELQYGWEYEKELESVVFTFYNPRKRLEIKKIIPVFELKYYEYGIGDYIANKIIEEAQAVL